MDILDRERIISVYSDRFDKYGHDPRTLGWDKGKQDLRFDILTSQWDIKGKSIVDLGCGFGDLNRYFEARGINDYEYLGVDVVNNLIEEAKRIYGCVGYEDNPQKQSPLGTRGGGITAN